jgi:hypothetical protein
MSADGKPACGHTRIVTDSSNAGIPSADMFVVKTGIYVRDVFL